MILMAVASSLFLAQSLGARAESAHLDFATCVRLCNQQRSQRTEQAWLICSAGLGAGWSLVEKAACFVEDSQACGASSRAYKVDSVAVPEEPEP